jgi:Protein of unknown function (DUF1573)
MKKIITLLFVLGLGLTTAKAQETSKKPRAKKVTATKVTGAGLLFTNETIDYGTIVRNAEGKREFEFTNNGTTPLIITNAQGSCGCTVPSFPKEPIMPGKKAIIGVRYDTSRPGAFVKNVTITSNAANQPTKILTIKGTVLADAAKS